jgi:hypothetical protein
MTDDRYIEPGADRCPECGGYAQRGCGCIWHDGKPDTHCSPACQCQADIKADLRHWHRQAITQEARADKAEAERDRLAARVETLEAAIGGVLTCCRECRDDLPFGAPGVPAEFIVWGKLAPPEALGPKCYDHAVKHLGDAMPFRAGQYAVVDLRPLRALVSPDTPTGPTDTVDRHEAYTMDAEGYIVPVSGGEPHTDTSTDNEAKTSEDKVVDLMAALEDSVTKAKAVRQAVREARETSDTAGEAEFVCLPCDDADHDECHGGPCECPHLSAGGDQPDTPCTQCGGLRRVYENDPDAPPGLVPCPACTDKETPHAR